MEAEKLPALRERAKCDSESIDHPPGRLGQPILHDVPSTLNCFFDQCETTADGCASDGAGILTQIPHSVLARKLQFHTALAVASYVQAGSYEE